MNRTPRVGDVIFAMWPGKSGYHQSMISIIDEVDGVACATFSNEGIVGCEALEDLEEIWVDEDICWIKTECN